MIAAFHAAGVAVGGSSEPGSPLRGTSAAACMRRQRRTAGKCSNRPGRWHILVHASDADLAAAVRAERQLEARTVTKRALARMDPAPGPRLEQLAPASTGRSPSPDTPRPTSPRACPVLPGMDWPFEWAQLQLDYG
jgi:hypothetical protein